MLVRLLRFPSPLFRIPYSILLLVPAAFFAWLSAIVWTGLPDPLALLDARLAQRRVTDRSGLTLRYLPDAKGDLCHPEQLDSLPLSLRHAFLAAEDAGFDYHFGLDPGAILRAAWQNLRAGRIVSGGSTISQQLARRLLPPRGRHWTGKLREALLALRLEWTLPKSRILEAYLNLVPMGGAIEGVGLAARVYFGKEPKALNLAEAASLAALPKAPGRFGRSDQRLEERRNWVLARMRQLGWISVAEEQTARSDRPRIRARRPERTADHFVDRVLAQDAGEKPGRATQILTTLDLPLQRRLETILHSHRERLSRRDCRQVAAVILDAASLEVLALAGSFRYGPRDQGYVDGSAALRSAGSVLKPFLYCLALEQQIVQPCTPLTDTLRNWRTPQGDYLPANADRQAHGPVTVRAALGNSLNLCAVHLLEELGGSEFYRLLCDLQLCHPSRGSAERYGLGMAIGNVEIRLLDLAAAYGVFSRGGRFSPVRWRLDRPPPPSRPLLDPIRVAQIADILADPTARMISFGNPEALDYPGPVLLKTGTSTRYRDCWIVHVNPREIIAIWAGNFDGAPTAGRSGSTACAPILKDLLRELHGQEGPKALPLPPGLHTQRVCGLSGGSPGVFCPVTTRELLGENDPDPPLCLWHSGPGLRHRLDGQYAGWLADRARIGRGDSFRLTPVTEARAASGSGPRILYPHHGDRFVLDPSGKGQIRFRAQSRQAVPWLRWFIDGRELAKTPAPHDFVWTLQRGRHRLFVASPDRAMDAIEFSVE